ncbi:MAG: hypothetical protein LIO58_07395 [Oscillospiraceae bacterium]|nr:hypothetical protein [Oscillospiraceae bacterium]
MENEINQLKADIVSSQNTVAMTGAGISYLYGVGRLKQQMHRGELMRVLSPKYVRSHPEAFYAHMDSAFLDATFRRGPGPVHKALVELEKRGKLQGIVTNNMDCLHTVAGSNNVVEIQGSFGDNICVDCERRYHDYTVWNHGTIPRCPNCNGPLMPANFYRRPDANGGEFRTRLERAGDMLSEAELVLIIGTTGFLSEEYMNRMNPMAKIVQLNPSETKFDRMANLNIREDAADVLEFILQ